MTDGETASLSWYQAAIWEPQTIFLSFLQKLSSEICSFLA
jgi:hypothetical protein